MDALSFLKTWIKLVESGDKKCMKATKESLDDAMKANLKEANITPEQEVDLIKHFLEKRYNRKFDKKIKISGYIDAPKFSLELRIRRDGNDGLSTPFVAPSGTECDNIFDVHENFLDQYWKDRKRQLDAENGTNPYDTSYSKEIYEKEGIASSRAELILKAQIQGLI